VPEPARVEQFRETSGRCAAAHDTAVGHDVR